MWRSHVDAHSHGSRDGNQARLQRVTYPTLIGKVGDLEISRFCVILECNG
jgi:hypothetical protein